MDAGADTGIANGDGHPAIEGISGSKVAESGRLRPSAAACAKRQSIGQMRISAELVPIPDASRMRRDASGYVRMRRDASGF